MSLERGESEIFAERESAYRETPGMPFLRPSMAVTVSTNVVGFVGSYVSDLDTLRCPRIDDFPFLERS